MRRPAPCGLQENSPAGLPCGADDGARSLARHHPAAYGRPKAETSDTDLSLAGVGGGVVSHAGVTGSRFRGDRVGSGWRRGLGPRCCGWRRRLPRGRLPDRDFEAFGWGPGGVVHRGGTGVAVFRRAMTTNGPTIDARGRTGRRPHLYILIYKRAVQRSGGRAGSADPVEASAWTASWSPSPLQVPAGGSSTPSTRCPAPPTAPL
jgi:hypothetical protein